ncbi:MAG: glycosyltransferase family 9 protein [Flavobacteriales bacterium]|nr:glycosyltransferase family 9 protein [Flavobacteriales bacterium]
MKILIIQTAFIGDVILATSVPEKLKRFFPQAQIDFLVRKGNESLLENNPVIHHILVWNKRESKLRNLLSLIGRVRKRKYDLVINLHRFASSGLITTFSGARQTIGFEKNPLSFFFKKKFPHIIGSKEQAGIHEVERNLSLVAHLTDASFQLPKLYPSKTDEQAIEKFCAEEFITISPASVWFTKQYPASGWIAFINSTKAVKIFLLGASTDASLCNLIQSSCASKSVENLAGKLSLLQSAALMNRAVMNYVNDSAPLHMCSAMNAPVTAVFCSTIPEFGFGPLSDNSMVIEIDEQLYCRSCGLHGKRNCPEGHFRCAAIDSINLLQRLA